MWVLFNQNNDALILPTLSLSDIINASFIPTSRRITYEAIKIHFSPNDSILKFSAFRCAYGLLHVVGIFIAPLSVKKIMIISSHTSLLPIFPCV